jgi:hypothetical protein
MTAGDWNAPVTESLTTVLLRLALWCCWPMAISILVYDVMRSCLSKRYRDRGITYALLHEGDPHWFWSSYVGWVKNHPLLKHHGEGMWWDTPDGKAPIDRWTWDQPQRRELQILGLG